jgi:hypothetical protein
LNDSGVYRAVAKLVSGGSAEFYSDPAVVYVNPADPLYPTPIYADNFRTDTKATGDLAAQQTVRVGEGGSVTLAMYPFGQGFAFSWSKVLTGGSLQPIASQTQSSLTLSAIKPADDGTYIGTVMVHKPDGTTLSFNSVPYRVVVDQLPVITSQPPLEQDRLPGETAILSVGASEIVSAAAASGIRFQWYYSSNNSPDALWIPIPSSGNTCTLDNVQESDEGYYRAEVTNSVGTVVSTSTHLVVRNPVIPTLKIATRPAGSTQTPVPLDASPGMVDVDPGVEIDLAVDIGNAVAADDLVSDKDHPVQYEFWRQQRSTGRWELIVSQKDPVYTIARVKESDDTVYKVLVSAKVNGRVYSKPVRLSVHDAVSFASSTPVNTFGLVQGESVSFQVAVNGYSPQYQWYFKPEGSLVWTMIPNSNSPVYALSSAKGKDAGSYGVIVYSSLRDDRGALLTAPVVARTVDGISTLATATPSKVVDALPVTLTPKLSTDWRPR